MHIHAFTSLEYCLSCCNHLALASPNFLLSLLVVNGHATTCRVDYCLSQVSNGVSYLIQIQVLILAAGYTGRYGAYYNGNTPAMGQIQTHNLLVMSQDFKISTMRLVRNEAAHTCILVQKCMHAHGIYIDVTI